MKQCLFCGTKDNLTKEHIFSAFLIRELKMKIYRHSNPYARDFRDDKGAVIKQVCASCNNGALSQLDGAAKDFFVNHNLFDKYVKVGQQIEFGADLKKWVCKVAVAGLAVNDEASSFFTDEIKKKIIDKNSDLSEITIFATAVDNNFFGSAQSQMFPYFSIRHSVDKLFDTSYVKVLLGQFAFIIFRTDKRTRLYHKLKYGHFQSIDNNIVNIDHVLTLNEYSHFLTIPALENLVQDYCFFSIILELFLKRTMYYLYVYDRLPKESTEMITPMQLAQQIVREFDLKIDITTDNMKQIILDYNNSYLKISQQIDFFDKKLVKDKLQLIMGSYPIFKQYQDILEKEYQVPLDFDKRMK